MKNSSFYFVFIALGLAVGAFYTGSEIEPTLALAQAGTQVPIPCLEAQSSETSSSPSAHRVDLPHCVALLDQKSPLSLEKQISDKFATRIHCYYRGSMVGNQVGDTGDKSCTGATSTAIGGTKSIVCNLADGEDATNYLGESCGMTNRSGSWETTHLRGLWVQAVKYFRDQVLQKEIVEQKKMKVSSLRCQPLVNDYLSLMERAKRVSDQFTALDAQDPSINSEEDLKACSKLNESQADQSTSTLGLLSSNSPPPSLGICYMAAVQANLVLIFAGLAECEILDRVDTLQTTQIQSKLEELPRMIEKWAEHATDVGNHCWDITSKHYHPSCLSKDSSRAHANGVFDRSFSSGIRELVTSINTTLMPGKFRNGIE